MLGALVDMQAADLLSALGVAGEHSLDGDGHGFLRVVLHQVLVGDFLQVTDPAGVPAQELLLELLAGEDGFLRVDDDDEIAAVNVGGERGFVLAAEQVRSLGGDAAQGLVSGVQNVPLAGNLDRKSVV